MDIDNQSSANYDYDKIGNLMSDVQGGLSNISWNVYGKIRSITKTNGTTIHYKYDPSGNRIEKSVTSGGVTTRDFYIRDAQGNILSVYRHEGGTLKLEELHLFGSSRLGLTELKRTVAEETIPLYPVHDSSLIGWKRYELSNHLGNVLAVISDKKTGVAGSGSSIDYYTAEVISEQDYYPFGMGMPGRKWSVGGYAYGFNGKMNDNDVKGNGNQQDYGMRIYDPRVGRFLSVDPISIEYPELTPYQFASNTPIESIDLDGLERAPAGKTKYGQPLESTAAVYYHKPVNEIIADSEEIERKKAQAFMAAMQQKRETVSAAKPSETKHVSELNRPARERLYDDQGYLPNGKKKLGTELAENKTFQKFDENIVQPAFLVSGGMELFQLGRFGFRQMVAKGGESWAKTSGILRDAVKGKGNYGLGSGTVDEAMQAGRSWVGEGFKISKDGSSWISADGLRQFRPPSFKPRLGIEQANFQWRNVNKGAWQSNGHLNIIKP